MLFMHLTGDNQVLLEVQDKLVKTDFKIRIDNEARLKIEELLGQNVIKKVGVDN